MSISIPDFWNLVTESRLLTLQEVERLAIAFSQIKGAAAQANAPALAEWLIAQNVVSRYQAGVLLAGQRGPFWFGDYKIHARIETGSLAGAYRAVHGPTEHGVLLEFVSAADAADLARWSNVSNRARRALAISHPHLRRCHELVDLGRYKFLVTEEPPGRSLDAYLAPRRPLPPGDACRVARQVASALAAWHAGEFVHGGLAPDQVFITPAGNVRLVQPALTPASAIDFTALGRTDDAGRRLAMLLDYLAPERFQPGREADTAADVYALGCVLYQMLAGRVPFPGGDVRQKALSHATQPIAPLAPLGVPQSLAQVVSYMMAKDASLRYASAGQVADALAAFIPPSALVPAIEPVASAAARYQSYLSRRPRNESAPSPELVKSATVTAVTPAARVAVGPPKMTSPIAAVQAAETGTRPRRRSNFSTAIGASVAAVLSLGLALYLYATSGGLQNERNAASSRSDLRPPETSPRNEKQPQADPPPPKSVGPSSAPSQKQTPPSGPVQAKPKTEVVTTPLPLEELIDDDRKTLWASPTAGAPLSLAHVGLGAQAALVLRPAELLADDEGSKFIKSLGPAGEQFVSTVEAAIGVQLTDVEQLVIALYPNGDLPPRASYVVRLKSETPEAKLAKNWKNVSPSKTRDGKKLYAGESYAYYLPPAEKGRVFAAGVVETIQEVAELDGKEPTLVVPLVKLLRSGDSARQLTFLCEPRLLFGDGRKLFAGVAERLREPLSRFLGDDVQAVATSLHLAEERLFLELRAIGRLERKPDALAQALANRVRDLAKQMDDLVLDTEITRHSKKLLNRFPQMLRELAAYLRVDTAADEAVLRCYLPAVAAHNLARSAELALHESTGATTAVVQAPATAPAADGLAGKLEKKITLSFPRDTLERSIELWAAEAGVKAVILGSDLQLEGITKNQSFGLDEKDQPAAAVLRIILKKASPDDKLIYVIKPEHPGGPDAVVITTLSAAVKRGDKLPPGFQAPKAVPKRKV